MTDQSRPINPDAHGNDRLLSPDDRLAAVMTAQHGVATLDQIREVGLTRKMVLRRRERGLLVPCFAGRSRVYRDPSAPETTDQTLLAAVFAAGDGAYASHEAAAFTWDLQRPTSTWAIEVATPTTRRPTARSIRYHRSYLVKADDTTTLRGIPVSGVALTIVDLSIRWSSSALGKAIDDALRRGLTTLDELEATTERLAPAPGRSKTKMMRLIALRRGGEASESELESFVLAAIRRFGLPTPALQHPFTIDSRSGRIDACYPEQRVALESLGYEWHVRARTRWDDDRFRANELVLAGWTVLEFTSAFTDWQVAVHVARALELPVPPRPARVIDFATWSRRKDRVA